MAPCIKSSDRFKNLLLQGLANHSEILKVNFVIVVVDDVT